MNLLNSGIDYDIGVQESGLYIDFRYTPGSNLTGDFSLGFFDRHDVEHLTYLFQAGRIYQHTSSGDPKFLDTYTAGDNRLRLNFDLSEGHDVFTDRLIFSDRSLQQDFSVIKVESDGFLSFEIEASGNTPDFAIPALNFNITGDTVGIINNHTDYPLIVRSIETPQGLISSFDQIINPSGNGNFIYEPYADPTSGSFYDFTFETNYGVFTKSLQINNPYDDHYIYNFKSIKGEDLVYVNRSTVTSEFTVSINTNDTLEPLYVSLSYQGGSGDVYGNYEATGVGSGIFSGYINRRGFLFSDHVVGQLTVVNDSGDPFLVNVTGDGTSSLQFYPTGIIEIPYSVPAYYRAVEFTHENGNVLESGGESGWDYTIYGPSGDIGWTGMFFGRISGVLQFEALESHSGIYPEIVVAGIPEYYYRYYDDEQVMEENISGFIFSGVIPIQGMNIQTFNVRETFGVFRGIANIFEGSQDFLSAWNLRIGKDPFDVEDYRLLGKHDDVSYFDPTGVQQMESGENTYYIYVDYSNYFRGSHEDSAVLNIQYKDFNESYEITGLNYLL